MKLNEKKKPLFSPLTSFFLFSNVSSFENFDFGTLSFICSGILVDKRLSLCFQSHVIYHISIQIFYNLIVHLNFLNHQFWTSIQSALILFWRDLHYIAGILPVSFCRGLCTLRYLNSFSISIIYTEWEVIGHFSFCILDWIDWIVIIIYNNNTNC